ncbi:MAG: HEAT repeat domain-containing protein [Planctomycetes bacterium]|nr:HEAT repeat domain-containing protein [Planctomycetota bacterium]
MTLLPRRRLPFLPLAILPTTTLAQHDTGKSAQDPVFVAAASNDAREQIKAFQLAPGLTCDLIAAEPHLCNVVAFAIDHQGRFYVAETFRINDGVFDTRNYMQWKDDDLACLTVADRLAKYHKHIAKDIPKYQGYPERVRLLIDDNKDGVVDRSTVFADQFTDLADGIASGVLPWGKDVWFTNIPGLWRLRDNDGDGKADERQKVHDGYGVHTSLIGHDLHGLIVGPDRRLYFSIGDRGFHVEHEGRTHAYPHEGAVLRCELDGSNLEVVHRGLRNPQELAFDQWGDLFTGDNNSDGGDRARLVQIVPGADSGWRIGYQWLDDRGAWNREKMWHPRHPGQPAWILPPICNFADGPSGLVYDPGVGLPERYRDCFFLCDFRGGASYSGVHAIQLQRQGAGFELQRTFKPIWSILATDVDFGPDGSMYVSDWVTGWNKTGKGRIYRVRTPQMANDLALRNSANLLASDFAQKHDAQLLPLLGHADRRVRQLATFALVDLGATNVLLTAAKNGDQRLARVHAIQGLGVLGRKNAAALDDVIGLLDDGDAEVRTHVCRVLGDARIAKAGGALAKALKDLNARVRAAAALALGRIGGEAAPKAVPALLALLRDNDDRDHLVRHAAVMGLVGAADREALRGAAGDASAAVRLGVLLAMARLQEAAIAAFLTDPVPALRSEAARAIYGEPIDAAMPALADLLGGELPDLPALVWRVVNANRILGTAERGRALVAFAQDGKRPLAARVEAVRILAEWRTPHGQDRVFGNWRPVQHPDADAVIGAFGTALPALLAGEDELARAASEAATALRLTASAAALVDVVAAGGRSADTRTAALQALDALGAAETDRAIAALAADAPAALRQAAVKIAARRNPAGAVPVLSTLLHNGNQGERQAALEALGDLQHDAATALLLEWLKKLAGNDVDGALQLELLEAAQKSKDPAVAAALAARSAALPQGDRVAALGHCREGGDVRKGREIFFQNEATRCTRCHTADGQGGSAGPVLDGIGKRQTRDYLLQSLVVPGAKIAEGFATTVLDLHNGDVVAGIVTRDIDGIVEVTNIDGDVKKVETSRISKRSTSKESAMPAMDAALTPRQLRDVVAFLASLQKDAKK